jgi:NitT/TauT family transport system permease protein
VSALGRKNSVGSAAAPIWMGKIGHQLLVLLPGIALLAFWQWASGRLIKELYISKPTAIVQRLFELFSTGEIYPHLWITGQELVFGYIFGVAGGVIGGYVLGRSPRLASVFEP